MRRFKALISQLIRVFMDGCDALIIAEVLFVMPRPHFSSSPKWGFACDVRRFAVRVLGIY